MLLDARMPEKPAGVLVDTGTGKRIPFARRFDAATGEWEAWAASPDGRNLLVETDDGKPVLLRGRAKGKLVLVPLDGAEQFGWKPPGRTIVTVPVVPEDAKQAGQEQYEKAYFQVWRWRGESRRCVQDRWEQYLKNSAFLDHFVIKGHR